MTAILLISFSVFFAGEFEHRLAFQPAHGQQALAAEFRDELRHMDVRAVLQHVTIQQHTPGLALIIDFLIEPVTKLRSDIAHEQAPLIALKQL